MAHRVVDKARAHARDLGVDNVEFVVGSAYELPFGGHSTFATGALEQGRATQADVKRISAAWREWAATPVSSLFIGDVLARG